MRGLDFIGRIDVDPLKEAVAEHARHFDDQTWRQDAPGTPHSATRTLYLRMPATISRESVFEALECQDGPLMGIPHFRDAVDAMAGLAGAKPARAMVVNLRAGGTIARHTDQGGYAAATERYHLAITTNPQCVMHVGEDSAHAREGEVWFFDKSQEHHVSNAGVTDRVHLILDVWKRPNRGITYQQESFGASRSEIAGLTEEHWRAVTDASGPALDIDWDHAIAADDLGMLRVMTVRSEGVLVGYAIYLLSTLPHYRTTLVASDDAYFLKPEFRKGMVGARMIQAAEKMLAECGVRRIIYHEKNKHPVGKLFRFLGYEPIETLWWKELPPPASNVRLMVRRPVPMRQKPLRRIPI